MARDPLPRIGLWRPLGTTLLVSTGMWAMLSPDRPVQVADQRFADGLQHYEAGRKPQAQAVFESQARQRHALATYNLAMMHLREEVPYPDPRQAVIWLAQAADQGLVRAMVSLGTALEQGVAGPRDLAQAHDWYEQAAARGHVESQIALGTAHYLGRGRPKDLAKAADWYRRAALSGDVGAQYLLASMYEAGAGVPQDLRLARHWYAQAAAGGDEAAPWKVKEIDARLRDGAEPAR